MNGRTPGKTFGQELIETLEEAILALRSGAELRTTRVFTLPEPPKFDGGRLVALRERLQMSQYGFADYLNVSVKAVQSWEQGVRRPNGAALRLLQVIEDPAVFSQMIPRDLQPGAAGKATKRRPKGAAGEALRVAERRSSYRRNRTARK